jgi:hypothetical protein
MFNIFCVILCGHNTHGSQDFTFFIIICYLIVLAISMVSRFFYFFIFIGILQTIEINIKFTI